MYKRQDLEIPLCATPPFSTVELALTVLANLPPQRDNSVIEHTVIISAIRIQYSQ